MGPNPSRPELNPYLFDHPIADDTPRRPSADTAERGTHQKLFHRLLESGFHIGGIEVGDTMGNPAGRAHFTAYYQAVVAKYRLDPKPCLFATSRGGLMAYNWAADHPQWVRCIGANQPVTDLALFPGLARAADIFGVPLQEFQRTYRQHNPADRLAPLAAHGVSLMHVIGGADTLLPAKNLLNMQERYRALGGQMQTHVHADTSHGLWPELLSDPRFHDFFVAQFGLERE
jgi:pimeloyl-ACP methyl ester carboxylesterase